MTILAHLQAGDGAADVLVHATGGVHALLALVLAGLATTGARLTVRRASTLFAATIAAGGAAAVILEPGAIAETVWMAGAFLAGATCVLLARRPGAMLVALAAFTATHGLAQAQHLTTRSGVDVASAPAILVATAGMYAIGVLVGQISDETQSRRRATMAIGGVTAVAAGLRLLVSA